MWRPGGNRKDRCEGESELQEFISQRKVSERELPNRALYVKRCVCSHSFYTRLFSLVFSNRSWKIIKMPQRKDLTLAQKINFLNEIKKLPKTSHRQLAEITKVPKSTIARLLAQEHELRKQWDLKGGEAKSSSQKRKRDGKNPEVEEALTEWFSAVQERGVSVSGPILKNKAEELAKKLGYEDFKSTDGWLSRWKSRKDIKFKREHGEKKSADTESAETWKTEHLPGLLEKFNSEDIYNADETGLFYRATPNGSLCFSKTSLSGYKKAMARMTVLCCSNMTGTDKKKLLVIGKSAKPRCFKGLKIDNMPVDYYHNRKAWMTKVIFEKWLRTWDTQLQKASRKICLVIDNCSAHPDLKDLKNIQLEFLPANTTSVLQPMDMGVIKNMKALYREKLVHLILQTIEDGLLSSSSSANDVSSRVNVLQAIQFVADSWRQLRSTTIVKCFARGGFKRPASESVYEDSHDKISENSELVASLTVSNYEDFLNIDEDTVCYDVENAWIEDEIIENIQSKRQRVESEDEEEDDDDPQDVRLVTLREARTYVDGLRQFFMQKGDENSPFASLDICADYVEKQSLINFKQSSLDSFITKS